MTIPVRDDTCFRRLSALESKAMTFLELLYGAEVLSQSGNPGIGGVEYDSRRIKPGDVFVAMQGESSDGNKFIDQAIAAGAVAVVTDSRQREAPSGCSLGPGSAWTPGAGATERQFLQEAGRTAGHHRHHRNQRKEHDCIPARIHSHRRWPQERVDRDHRISRCRKDSARSPYHSRSAGTESHPEPGSGTWAPPKP